MLNQQRILVIDDEPFVRESCKRIFADKGYDVETASSGEEGLEMARRGYFDCALVDLKMPGINGMEVVRTVRENRPGSAVLIITGYGDLETAAEATRLGVSDYVLKPFTPDQIIEAVDVAITNHTKEGALPGVTRLVSSLSERLPGPEAYEDRSPQAVAQMVTRAVGTKKIALSMANTLVLGALAGAYIGFGAAMATLVGSDAPKLLGVGLSQVAIGAVFSLGLILVVIAGAELFTGNNLMVAGWLGRQFGASRMLLRWLLVFVANFIGSVLLAWMVYESGIWKLGGGVVAQKALAIANAKVQLGFSEAFFRGIGCNWLVCLAVWMSLSAREITGKILAIFFPIMAFVALGFEHCVANMYFIPMGLMLKAGAVGGTETASLTCKGFLVDNLIPVTIGNIVGGAIFVGSIYWWVYVRVVTKKSASKRS